MRRHHRWSSFDEIPSPLSTDVDEIATYIRLTAVSAEMLAGSEIDLCDEADAERRCYR